MKAKRTWTISIAIISWFALVLQLYLMLDRTATAGESMINAIINFFSYFTILSNIFVAIVTTVSSFRSSSPGFFSRINVQSAIALYIFIVALVYNLVLRSQWNPKGWQLIADNLLHV